MGLQAYESMSHRESAFRPGSFCRLFVLLNLQSRFSLGRGFSRIADPIVLKGHGFRRAERGP